MPSFGIPVASSQAVLLKVRASADGNADAIRRVNSSYPLMDGMILVSSHLPIILRHWICFEDSGQYYETLSTILLEHRSRKQSKYSGAGTYN
ncbi:hypothetical protein GIB67_042051 [Kingdonia uniflora]|uniref:Uncharacterized protein n=1 Tax=Kingdonia uniflora TaxID=39325 RepID=A0A7J7MW13_9MAGN|nr:hypothetical protein GIB67_042051 [Kingdonia uniflora]